MGFLLVTSPDRHEVHQGRVPGGLSPVLSIEGRLAGIGRARGLRGVVAVSSRDLIEPSLLSMGET
jgi:hypothetical protein